MIIHKNWLYYFTFKLVKWIFVKHDTKIVILSLDVNIDNTKSGKFAEDLSLMIIILIVKYNRFRLAEN